VCACPQVSITATDSHRRKQSLASTISRPSSVSITATDSHRRKTSSQSETTPPAARVSITATDSHRRKGKQATGAAPTASSWFRSPRRILIDARGCKRLPLRALRSFDHRDGIEPPQVIRVDAERGRCSRFDHRSGISPLHASCAREPVGSSPPFRSPLQVGAARPCRG